MTSEVGKMMAIGERERPENFKNRDKMRNRIFAFNC